MQLVILHPDGDIDRRPERDSFPSLDELQTIVGGYIEHIHVDFDGAQRDAFVNEEGRLRGMEPNAHATIAALRFGYGRIVGPCVVTIFRDESERTRMLGE